MTSAIESRTRARRVTLSKVPEVTVWFWLIKVLCTTVGESFADWVNTGLGVGLGRTTLIFTVVLAVTLGVQLAVGRYLPLVYWLTVVVLSVTGTLYTDVLTDKFGVPLALSTGVFAGVLAVVFGVWFARERTLSIHSIITLPRELFYWLAVLVTFALGTAAGDWTLALTGWGPGVAVLLPVGLIVVVAIGWRAGVNAVLSFWVAYVLTRPLGANLGDWFASPTTDHGLGLGYGVTSVIFLAAIAGAVGYLTISHADVIDVNRAPDDHGGVRRTVPTAVSVGYYAVVMLAAAGLLGWAASQPHRPVGVAGEDELPAVPTASAALHPGQVASTIPAPDLAQFRTIVQDTLTKVDAGDQSGARARIRDLESVWDDDQARLQPAAPDTWSVLDGQIDAVLKSIRSSHPDPVHEKQSLTTLLVTLG
ncbi:putative membrane-anchored protein [Mycobacterium sp. MAA66]|uniref:COG4705 family protein n=1 Tax=Mycobacterium sp. MAA66 TaxID=3156297 RepID=UPI003516DC27